MARLYANGIDQAGTPGEALVPDPPPEPVAGEDGLVMDEIVSRLRQRGERITAETYAAEHARQDESQGTITPMSLAEADGIWLDRKANEILKARRVERPHLRDYKQALSEAYSILARARRS